MSLTTVTIALDNKLRTLRCKNKDEISSEDDEEEEDEEEDEDEVENKSVLTRKTLKSNVLKLKNKIQPLTLLDDIPYADESPERILISSAGSAVKQPQQQQHLKMVKQNSFKGANTSYLTNQQEVTKKSSLETILQAKKQHNNSDQGVDGLSTTSSDTDTSTTSNSAVQMNADVFRKMNRILTNLERNTTKMNRSLSLNYKSQQKGGDCCCHVNHRLMNRGVYPSMTKDEKTDKNLKKRNSQENALNGGGSKAHTRRYGNRSIRRRHTVGGSHDYSPKFIDPRGNEVTPCHNYVMRLE